MNIAVIGTGYVGLVTGAGLADFGNDVICCDIDPKKIDALNNGQIPIYEPGLDKIVSRNVSEGRLRFTTDLGDAIQRSRAIFIAVGTPPKQDGSANLQYVEQVANTIAQHMNGPKLVITKSTVPIGTGRLIEGILEKTGNGQKGSVVSNPEFLREGSAIEDFLKPDRVVIGASDDESIELMKEIYAPLHSLEIPFVVTNVESAELIKYAANGFLATKISLAPTCRMSHSAWDSILASVRSSCSPVPASAAPAFRKTAPRWPRSRAPTAIRFRSWKRCSASTTTSSSGW